MEREMFQLSVGAASKAALMKYTYTLPDSC